MNSNFHMTSSVAMLPCGPILFFHNHVGIGLKSRYVSAIINIVRNCNGRGVSINSSQFCSYSNDNTIQNCVHNT